MTQELTSKQHATDFYHAAGFTLEDSQRLARVFELCRNWVYRDVLPEGGKDE